MTATTSTPEDEDIKVEGDILRRDWAENQRPPATSKTKTVFDRKEEISISFTRTSNDIRYRIARAIRSLLGAGNKAALLPEDFKKGPKAIKPVADAMRHAAALIDSLHEIARADLRLSNDIETIVADLADMVYACRDFEALSLVSSDNVQQLSRALDASAQAVEKSEEVLDLIGQLTDIEYGVNNLGISRDEFRRLAGTNGAQKEGSSIPLSAIPSMLIPTMRESLNRATFKPGEGPRTLPDDVIGKVTTMEKDGSTYEFEVKRDDAVVPKGD